LIRAEAIVKPDESVVTILGDYIISASISTVFGHRLMLY
jgi:hypothetical protein